MLQWRRAKLDQLEEKQAEVEEYKRRLERLQRDSEERLQGTATELRRLQLEKTMLQVCATPASSLKFAPIWHSKDTIQTISKCPLNKHPSTPHVFCLLP